MLTEHMNMLVVSVFGNVNSDTNHRINSLHDYLSFDLKVVTTDFSHGEKHYRSKDSKRNIDYLHVSSYKKNLSVARIFSHWTFAIRLFFYLLKNGKGYHVIYCITPTPSSAFVCSVYKWFSRHKFLIIDVIDIWPEGLIPLGKKYKWLSPFLLPWRWLSIIAYKSANAIFAATSSYQLQASRHNSKVFSAFYPLGIDPQKIQLIRNRSILKLVKAPNEIWIAYAGNLGASYDFGAMINAVVYARDQVSEFILKFVLIGGGNRKNELETRLLESGLDYLITGNVEYMDYLNYLNLCDIGFNIYSENTEVIQSYKFNDYVVSGTYIINNLKGETAELIDSYNIGENLTGQNNQLGVVLVSILNKWNLIKMDQDKKCSALINNVLSKQIIYHQLEKDILKVIDIS